MYEASNAVDGNTATCMRTIVIGTGLSTPDKTVWWKVDLGGVYNIYRINILFKNYDGYGMYYYDLLSLCLFFLCKVTTNKPDFFLSKHRDAVSVLIAH